MSKLDVLIVSVFVGLCSVPARPSLADPSRPAQTTAPRADRAKHARDLATVRGLGLLRLLGERAMPRVLASDQTGLRQALDNIQGPSTADAGAFATRGGGEKASAPLSIGDLSTVSTEPKPAAE